MYTITIKMKNRLSTASLRNRLNVIAKAGLKPSTTSAATITVTQPALLSTATRSAAMLRSCLNAIAVGEVPASVATLIDKEILRAEEERFLAETSESFVVEILWRGCGLLEIAALVNSEMHRLQHPTGCEDRATCQHEREVREKRALASAYESLRSDLMDKRKLVQVHEVHEVEEWDSDSS